MADPTPSDDTASPSLDAPQDAANASASQISPDQSQAGTQDPAQTSGDPQATAPVAPADDRAELLKVVQEVVKTDPKTPLQGEDQSAAPGTKDPKTETPTPDPLEADPTEAELKAMAPRTKARVDQLLKQRGEARAELETLKPDAAKWQQMDGYLTRHSLAAEDVNLLLGVGAALRRGDWKAFHDGVMPYVEMCRENLGMTLPADLQGRVDSGEMTTEAATELSVARLANARLQGEAKVNQDRTDTEKQAETERRTFASVSDAVTTWEKGIRSRDPDYARKADTVRRISLAIIAEKGRPATVEAAVAYAKEAYDETNRIFAAATPAPVPTRPAPVGARAVSNNGARAEPRTMMEAVMAAMDTRRA